MKTKNKILAIAEIAIVLCSMFLVAIPAIAADQTAQKTITTTSEDEFTLGIYGNANEDDTIDMRDTTYIKLAIFGKKPKTDLADANYDGKVSMLDVGQTKLIILGKEKELWFIERLGETAMVHKPIEGLIAVYASNGEVIRTLGAKDRVIGVCNHFLQYPTLYPDLSKLPCVGHRKELDVEKILELEPDVVIMTARRWHQTPELEDKLKGTGIDIVRLDPTEETLPEMKKLGYILDEEENAREYFEWHKKYIDTIREGVSEIPGDEKPKVLIERYTGNPGPGCVYTRVGGSTTDKSVELAGGKNIAHELPGEGNVVVETEWVIEQNPDVIIGIQSLAGYESDDVSEIKATYDVIIGRSGFDHIKAVKECRVHLIVTRIAWGPGHIIACTYIAKWLHPDLFEDLDPQAVHQEYIDRFQGIDFDVSEHGVFVYPKLS